MRNLSKMYERFVLVCAGHLPLFLRGRLQAFQLGLPAQIRGLTLISGPFPFVMDGLLWEPERSTTVLFRVNLRLIGVDPRFQCHQPFRLPNEV